MKKGINARETSRAAFLAFFGKKEAITIKKF